MPHQQVQQRLLQNSQLREEPASILLINDKPHNYFLIRMLLKLAFGPNLVWGKPSNYSESASIISFRLDSRSRFKRKQIAAKTDLDMMGFYDLKTATLLIHSTVDCYNFPFFGIFSRETSSCCAALMFCFRFHNASSHPPLNAKKALIHFQPSNFALDVCSARE